MSAVPKLRFSDFEGGWTKYSLSDVCEFSQGIQIPMSEQFRDYQHGMIRYLYIRDFFSDIYPWFVMDEYANKVIQTNEIMVVNTGNTAGKVFTGKTGVLSNNCFKISSDRSRVDDKLLFQFLSSSRTQKNIQRFFNSGGQPHLGHKNIGLLTLTAPAVPEQKKIADFLEAVDDKIAGLRERERLLIQYKKGVMQKIFSQALRFKADDGSDFPDWEKRIFGEVFERVKRKNTENNKNVLTISAQQGLINQEEYFNKSVSAKDVTGYYLIKRGEFAYNKSYSKGYPMGALKRLTRYEQGVVSTLYICFVSKAKTCEEFYEHYFEGGLLNRELHKIAQEGARNHGLLNLSVIEFFRDMVIDYPHPDEQQKIADFLTAIDAKITTVSAQITQMQDFKKGLLQQMFV